jgi:hypothetical protein
MYDRKLIRRSPVRPMYAQTIDKRNTAMVIANLWDHLINACYTSSPAKVNTLIAIVKTERLTA